MSGSPPRTNDLEASSQPAFPPASNADSILPTLSLTEEPKSVTFPATSPRRPAPKRKSATVLEPPVAGRRRSSSHGEVNLSPHLHYPSEAAPNPPSRPPPSIPTEEPETPPAQARILHRSVDERKDKRRSGSSESAWQSAFTSQEVQLRERPVKRSVRRLESHDPSPALPTPLTPMDMDVSFEEYIQESQKEIEQQIASEHLRDLRSKLKGLQDEVQVQSAAFQSTETILLFQAMSKVVSAMQTDVDQYASRVYSTASPERPAPTCGDTTPEDPHVQSLRSFHGLCSRVASTCEHLIAARTGEIKFNERQANTLKLLERLCASETAYTSELMCMQRFFREPLLHAFPHLTREDTVLFSELENLLTLHKTLLKDVRYVLDGYPHVPVGQFLLYYAPKFAPYIVFCESSEESREMLDKLMKENKDFRHHVRELERRNNTSLAELLRVPLFRIQQFVMYTEQFCHFAPPKSQDRVDILAALDELQSILDQSKSKEDLATQLQQLQKLGEEIEDLDENMVVPDRLLVYEGPARLKPDSADAKPGDYLFLFSDMLVYTQRKSSSRRFHFLGKIGMHTLHLEGQEGAGLSFTVIQQKSPSSKQTKFTVTLDSEKQKAEWLVQLNNVRRQFIRERKVFGVDLKILVRRDNQPVPLLVTKSVNFIREYGLQAEGIFRVSGRSSQIEKLREQFDQGKKVFFSSKMDVHTVSTLLKQWLREMPEPLLTWKLYDEFIATESLRDPKAKLLSLQTLIHKKLPRINRHCFQVLLKLLSQVTENEAHTKLNASSLAVVFAPNVLVNGDPDVNPFSLQYEAVNKVFQFILENYAALFQELENELSRPPATAKFHKRISRSTSLKMGKIPPRVMDSPEPITHSERLTKTEREESLSSTSSPLLSRDPHQAPVSPSPPTPEAKPTTISQGPLLVQEKHKWIERYFIIKGNSLCMYKSADEVDKKARNRIQLTNRIKIHADPSLGKPFAFALDRKKDNTILAANTKDELMRWIHSLSQAQQQHSKN